MSKDVKKYMESKKKPKMTPEEQKEYISDMGGEVKKNLDIKRKLLYGE